MPERVIVAMSGGVDSSLAAARLVDAGLEVVGVTLHLWDYPTEGAARGRCCAPEDIHDARRVCDFLGIAHYAFDRRELFRREVVEPFVAAYLAGTTPSPCVRCNRGVKIAELLGLAERLGASCVATGHYARIEVLDHRPALLRGRDLHKDQSYFLHMLPTSVLGRLRFPLGELTKAEVRAEARARRLPGAEKGESQELCFVPTGRYDAFVASEAPARVRPGPILDGEGRRVGTHDGVHGYTVGQRRNLGVALGRRSYVVAIDAESGAVRLGDHAELLATGALLDEVVLADGLSAPLRCEAVVRYRGVPRPAELARADGGFELRFDEPVSAMVPGQVAVFYRGDRVLGGGVIRSAIRTGSAARLAPPPRQSTGTAMGDEHAQPGG